MAKRKAEEKQSLVKVLEENEINKKKQLENAQKAKEEDIKLAEEYTKLLDKQEEDRANYFKNKQKQQNQFMQIMSNTVIKEQESKLKEELDKIRLHQQKKNEK